MITTVLFDLDGTLLPMDQEAFVKAYLDSMARKMVSYGYVPEQLAAAVWKGTGAMVKNDGSRRNDTVFWEVFSAICGKDARKDEPYFEDFYRKEFQNVKSSCGFDPRSAETIHTLKDMGLRIALATNPLFPAIATQSRVRWAGLKPEDFEFITTYENSFHCKPNPDYYLDVLTQLGVAPQECLMVGNDADEDMVARELGMQVFLLTDCIINRDGSDISRYPNGSFPELMTYIRSLIV